MREIKFRGKSFDKGWIYGNLIKSEQSAWIRESDYYNFKVKPETVGQYTGLKDKNGKEIYEGDVLKYAGGGIYIVVFDEMMIMCPHDNIEMPSPGYYAILIGDKTKELCPLGITEELAEVIGNIYENSDLLKD